MSGLCSALLRVGRAGPRCATRGPRGNTSGLHWRLARRGRTWRPSQAHNGIQGRGLADVVRKRRALQGDTQSRGDDVHTRGALPLYLARPPWHRSCVVSNESRSPGVGAPRVSAELVSGHVPCACDCALRVWRGGVRFSADVEHLSLEDKPSTYRLVTRASAVKPARTRECVGSCATRARDRETSPHSRPRSHVVCGPHVVLGPRTSPPARASVEGRGRGNRRGSRGASRHHGYFVSLSL